jgi:hypothetical protein
MANIKFSQFTNQAAADTTYLVGFDGTDNTNYTKAQIKTWLTSGSNAIPTLYSENGTLAGNRTITMDGNTLSMAQASGNTVTFSSLNNEGISIAGGFNYKIATGSGAFTIDSSTTSNSNAVVLQTNNGAGANASILIDSRSPGANADLHLKTATKLKIDLPVAATVGYVLKADDVDGNVSWGAETDTNTNIANTNLNLDASRTLGLGANQNLTFTGSGTSKVTFSNSGGVQFDEDVTFVKNSIIQGQAYTELHTGAAIASINWDDGNVQEITLAVATVTFNPSNPKAGATYILKITQPGGGGPGAITWGSGVKWAGGSPPTLTSGSSAVDIVTLICTDATGQGVYYANATLNFS